MFEIYDPVSCHLQWQRAEQKKKRRQPDVAYFSLQTSAVMTNKTVLWAEWNMEKEGMLLSYFRCKTQCDSWQPADNIDRSPYLSAEVTSDRVRVWEIVCLWRILHNKLSTVCFQRIILIYNWLKLSLYLWSPMFLKWEELEELLLLSRRYSSISKAYSMYEMFHIFLQVNQK